MRIQHINSMKNLTPKAISTSAQKQELPAITQSFGKSKAERLKNFTLEELKKYALPKDQDLLRKFVTEHPEEVEKLRKAARDIDKKGQPPSRTLLGVFTVEEMNIIANRLKIIKITKPWL